MARPPFKNMTGSGTHTNAVPATMSGSRRLLARLRDVMAGGDEPQQRLNSIVSIIAAPILQLGIIYLFVAIFFGSNLMFKSYNLFRRRIQPIKYFVFSNTYLAVIFIGIVADVLWTLKEI